MKTKVKESSRLDTLKNSTADKHSYYFHADEDFREDRDWGKTKPIGFSSTRKTSKALKKSF